MIATPLPPPVLPLGFPLRLAVRLRLVTLTLQPLHLGFKLGGPGVALGELRLSLGELLL